MGVVGVDVVDRWLKVIGGKKNASMRREFNYPYHVLSYRLSKERCESTWYKYDVDATKHKGGKGSLS